MKLIITVVFGTVFCAALYHQVLGDGVTKCYVCEIIVDPECEDPKETNCGGVANVTWVCLTALGTLDNRTVAAKQCIPSSIAEQTCKAFNNAVSDGSCSYCTKDLCNSDN